MKTMTCKQLGGACDMEFHAETFEKMADLSQQHGQDMFQEKDSDHLKAMDTMRAKMANPEEMQQWMSEKRAEFDALPNKK